MLCQNNGRQNGLASRMVFSELYKITVSKVTFAGLGEPITPNAPLDQPLVMEPH